MNDLYAVDNRRKIDALNSRLISAHFDYEKEVGAAIRTAPSQLDAYDYIFSIVLGIVAAILDTNDKITVFLDEIHQLSSKENIKDDNRLKEAIARVLQHNNSWMDKVNLVSTVTNEAGETVKKEAKRYVSRVANKVAKNAWDAASTKGSGPHRIFWGHDIFSLKQDNPFALCIKEYGIGKGIINAIRHLIADTCSHQGLPLPFSSYFDYIDVDEGDSSRVCNRLLDFCQEYSSEVLGKKQGGVDNEIFNHLFSLHQQDIMSTGLVMAGIAMYGKARDITDATKMVQLRVIGYMGLAYGSAIIGAAIHDGIPYINWPAFVALGKNVVQMVHITNEEIDGIFAETERLASERIHLETAEASLRSNLTESLQGTLRGGTINAGRNALIDFLGGN